MVVGILAEHRGLGVYAGSIPARRSLGPVILSIFLMYSQVTTDLLRKIASRLLAVDGKWPLPGMNPGVAYPLKHS